MSSSWPQWRKDIILFICFIKHMIIRWRTVQIDVWDIWSIKSPCTNYHTSTWTKRCYLHKAVEATLITNCFKNIIEDRTTGKRLINFIFESNEWIVHFREPIIIMWTNLLWKLDLFYIYSIFAWFRNSRRKDHSTTQMDRNLVVCSSLQHGHQWRNIQKCVVMLNFIQMTRIQINHRS